MISVLREAVRLGLVAAVALASSQVAAQQPFYQGKRLKVRRAPASRPETRTFVAEYIKRAKK